MTKAQMTALKNYRLACKREDKAWLTNDGWKQIEAETVRIQAANRCLAVGVPAGV
jgi:hypothetical protein